MNPATKYDLKGRCSELCREMTDLLKNHNTDTEERLREMKTRSVTENLCAGLSLSPGLNVEVICTMTSDSTY